MKPPRARSGNLLRADLDDEVVLYDPVRKEAHSLNRVAVAVWNHADGTNTIERLQRLASDEIGTPIDQEAVWLALRKLERAHLLMEKLAGVGPMTRREVMGKAGKYGAAAMATAVITSAPVPAAAQVASPPLPGGCPGGGGTCTSSFFPCSSSNPDCVFVLLCGPSGPSCICVPASTQCSSLVPCGAGNTCPPGSTCACNTCCSGPVCVPGSLTAACPLTPTPATTTRVHTAPGTIAGS
jgi:Coenzyme PQQ synthesis protein D (PqqD)